MPISALVLSRSIRTQKKAALSVARSCLLPSAYQVHLRRSGEPNWQFAGTVETGAPLPTLSLPELSPGEYEVQVSAQGFAWDRHERASRARFLVSASGAEPSLPAVSDLQAVLEDTTVVLSWLWKLQLGTQMPSEFAVWISQTDSIDTQAAPTVLVPADGIRRQYASTSVPGRFAGVAARHSGQAGILTIVALPQSPPALPSPGDQYIKIFSRDL